MPLVMPSPTKHPDSGMYYFRVRVPAGIKAPVGKRTIKESLHKKDAAEAQVLFTERSARANKEWAAQRAGPQRLTLRQIVALARISTPIDGAGEFAMRNWRRGRDGGPTFSTSQGVDPKLCFRHLHDLRRMPSTC